MAHTKIIQSLTTAADMHETIKMLMEPNANWEEYLTSAPLSIAIMGELVFISSDVNNDFSINKKPPPKGFRYIEYPDSSRACLMQICNSGWQASNEAHKNMDQIRIHTDFMKEAVKILFIAPDEVIDILLPNQLANISDIADKCLILAEEVLKKYSDVIHLIQELLEACLNAECFYRGELQNMRMKIEDTWELDEFMMKMLVKGMDAMGRVKEQWEKMVGFFQMVSTILHRTLKHFVTTAEDTQKLSYNNKLFIKDIKDMLYNQVFQASNITSLVHMISGTYTEVSSKYLMDRVSSLGKLMAMDKSNPQFMTERKMLQDSCREAQDGILQLVLKNKKEFEEKTDARMAKIEGSLKAVLPAASPEKIEEMKKTVQAGFGEGEEDFY